MFWGKILDFYDLDKKKLGEGLGSQLYSNALGFSTPEVVWLCLQGQKQGYEGHSSCEDDCQGLEKGLYAWIDGILQGKMKNIERFKQEIAIMKMMDLQKSKYVLHNLNMCLFQVNR